jgi:hypothetical protein
MSWWNAVPALTPVVAFDCLHMESQYIMTDLSGGGKHLNTTNQPSGAAISSPTDTAYVVVGNGNNATHTRVTTPSQGLLCAYVRNVNPRVMCFSDYGGPNGNPYALLIERDNPAPYGQLRNSGSTGAVNMPDDALVKFVALRFNGTVWQFYYNGNWLGSEQTADFAASVLPSSTGSTGPSSWGWNAGVSCIGMFSGACTLADIQLIESTARAEFEGPDVGSYSVPFDPNRSINNPLALNPGPPPSLSAQLKYSWKNIYQGGNGTIQGTTTIENIPGSRQVRLYDKRSGLLVAETWSSPTGHYEFNNIDSSKEYFVVAHDHLRVYNGVISDMLTP